MIVDLESKRRERALVKAAVELAAAQTAQEMIDSQAQLRHAREAADVLWRFDEDDDACILLADAVAFEVDALLNQAALPQAGLRAREARRHLDVRKSHRHAVAVVRRIDLTVREYSGRAADAQREFLAGAIALRHDGLEQLEELLYLQHAVSCARRCDSAAAELMAKRACRIGLLLAETLEERYPHAVACFRHVAGCAEMRLVSEQSDPDAAVELFDRSLAHRRDTRRDRTTRGMGIGERLLAAGDRDGAIVQFAETVDGFADVLPRHHESACAMLSARGLLAA